MRPRVLLLGGAALCGAALGWALMSEDGWPKTQRLEEERAALEAKAARFRAEITTLAGEASALQDTGGENPVLEQVVRTELGYVRQDEVILLMGDEVPPEGHP